MTDPLKDVGRAASHWVTRRSAGTMSPQETAEFERWLAESPEHRAAFDQAQDVWATMDGLRRPEFAALRAYGDRPEPKRWTKSVLPLGAAMAAAMAIVVFLAAQNGDPAATEPATYATAVGQQLPIRLPDGSTMLLNTASDAQTHYTASVREIVLSKGDAFFEVEHDPGRPFIVRTPKGEVTAVGTAFAVSVRDPAFEVSVTEGVVRVDIAKPQGRAEPVRLAAGERLTADAVEISQSPPNIPAVERRLAWRSGRHVFDGEPLPQALRQIALYSDEVEFVVDPALNEMRVVGTFNVAEVDDILNALEEGGGVKVERSPDGKVLLSPK